MANYTENYKLTKPVGTDLYDIDIFNENMDKIDSALGDYATVGCGSNGLVGWYPVGTINIKNKTYYTYNVQLSVLGNGGRGSGILDIFLRVDDIAGNLNMDASYMYFLSRSDSLNPTHFAIDITSGEAILYVYCPKSHCRYRMSVLSEAYGNSDSGSDDNYIKLNRNYSDSPVININYVENITNTLTAKDPKHAYIADLIYPVGSIYMSVNSTSPATLFGGEWERIKDTFLLSAGDTYEADATGGEAEHTLTLEELPNFKLPVTFDKSYAHATWEYIYTSSGKAGYNVDTEGNPMYAEHKNGNQPHNNMPPYLVVYVWKRIA